MKNNKTLNTTLTTLALVALGSTLVVACGDSSDEGAGGAGGGAGDSSTGGSGGTGGGATGGAGGASGGIGGMGGDAMGGMGGSPDVCELPELDAPAAMGGAGPMDPLQVAGTYSDGYGEIAVDSFGVTITYPPAMMGDDPSVSTFAATGYTNEGEFMLTQNSLDNTYNPGKWSRFSWTTFEGEFYWCQAPYGAESETGAFCDEAPPSRIDPTADGSCGGFTWSKLTPVVD